MSGQWDYIISNYTYVVVPIYEWDLVINKYSLKSPYLYSPKERETTAGRRTHGLMPGTHPDAVVNQVCSPLRLLAKSSHGGRTFGYQICQSPSSIRPSDCCHHAQWYALSRQGSQNLVLDYRGVRSRACSRTRWRNNRGVCGARAF